MKRAWLSLGIPVLHIVMSIPAPVEPPRLFTETRPAMGASFTIHLYASDERRAAALFEMSFDEVERVEEMLSNYRPSSELARVNRLAAGEPVTTDAEMLAFLEQALDYSRRSNGAFDITVGPLSRAWGFFRGQGRYPSRDELANARGAVGWRKVELDRASRTVRFLAPGVQLDPGGIGKGYAVDRVIGLLRDVGVQSALVDAASSTMAAIGSPPGEEGWLVHVPVPGDRAHSVSTVLLRDNALSTSGSSVQFFRAGGRTYGHVFDPRTGRPVQGVLQITVIAREGTATDALSTAMFVLGPEKGKKLLKTIPGARALWIVGEPAAPRLAKWNWESPATITAASSRAPSHSPAPPEESVARRHQP